MNDYYRILSYDNKEETFEYVLVPFDLKNDYIKEFGTLTVPDFYDLSIWVEETVVLNKIEKLNKK